MRRPTVSWPRITSTSGSTGAGLKKCMPARRCGCSREAAISVTESAEVFVAKTASGPITASIRPKRSCLTARSSNTASITRSQSASAATSATGSSSPSMRSLSSSVSRPFSTPRANWRSISPRPRAASSLLDSHATVGTPGLDAELGDARAHRPQPDDAYLLHNSRALVVHSEPLSLFGWLIGKRERQTRRPASAPALIALTKSPGCSASPRTTTSGPSRRTASDDPRGLQPTAVATFSTSSVPWLPSSVCS